MPLGAHRRLTRRRLCGTGDPRAPSVASRDPGAGDAGRPAASRRHPSADRGWPDGDAPPGQGAGLGNLAQPPPKPPGRPPGPIGSGGTAAVQSPPGALAPLRSPGRRASSPPKNPSGRHRPHANKSVNRAAPGWRRPGPGRWAGGRKPPGSCPSNWWCCAGRSPPGPAGCPGGRIGPAVRGHAGSPAHRRPHQPADLAQNCG